MTKHVNNYKGENYIDFRMELKKKILTQLLDITQSHPMQLFCNIRALPSQAWSEDL